MNTAADFYFIMRDITTVELGVYFLDVLEW